MNLQSLYLNNPISSRYCYEKENESYETQPETESETSDLDENFTSKYLYDNELICIC